MRKLSQKVLDSFFDVIEAVAAWTMKNQHVGWLKSTREFRGRKGQMRQG
jgi:hypothetical protein